MTGYLQKSDCEQQGSAGYRELAGCSVFGSVHLGIRQLRYQLYVLSEPSVDPARETCKKESLGMIDMDVVAKTWLKGICLEGESKGRGHNFC